MRILLVGVLLLGATQDSPKTGPGTEKRFPPLKVPEGFKVTLFACDPLIEYPSVMSIGPKAGSIFLAHDYVTGLGFEILRRSEVRLVEDADGDGYADQSTVYAGGFNSIQGLALHDGRVYVMHSPFLTMLRDTNGDGVADERRDLFNGLGWTPEKAPDRLHGANGVVAGRDGWLYLAQGDRGCDGLRVEGDRLVLNGGGILRCRPDGTDLHVFSTGLRNIYDVALDDEGNVFVRDNENDGGTYMIRVARSFFGADHGYPYLYEDRPDEGLKPLADLGRGSSAGIVCYLARAFPEEYRGDLFCCEWGRSVVRYRRTPHATGFAQMKEIEFAAGSPGDPYGFKPTDLVVDRDGSLLVSDWSDDQRPKRGRGRVYRIRYEGPPDKTTELPDPFQEVRTVDVGEKEPLERLFKIAGSLLHDRVRIQAIRAIADLADPVLVKHRLDAGPADPEIARRLSETAGLSFAPSIIHELVVALGRLRWAGAPAWMRKTLVTEPDVYLGHAVQQTLRRSANWPAVLEWLDDASLRPIALRALAEQAEPQVVDGLIRRLDAPYRREAADLLTRVHRKRGPWVYWGFRPGPRPANTETWERTEAIEQALDRLLADPDRGTRLAVLRRMQREKIAAKPGTLVRWLKEERRAEPVAAILVSLRDAPADPQVSDAAEVIVRDRAQTVPNRLTALGLLGADRLPPIAGALEDSAVLAEALRQLKGDSRDLVRAKLTSSSPEVRLAAVEAWGNLGDGGPLLPLLEDRDASVRAAAASAAGKLRVKEAADRLLLLAKDSNPQVRGRSFEALRRLREPRALPVALKALDLDAENEFPALEAVAELGSPEQAEAVAAVAMRSRSPDSLQAAVRALTAWKQAPAIAKVHGASGVILHWTAGAEEITATGSESRATFRGTTGSAEIVLSEGFRAQFLASSSGTFTVSVNDQVVHRRAATGAYAPDSDRFDAELKAGVNRLVVDVSSGAQVHARFRRKSAVERHERLAQQALATKGTPERGRELFLNAEKTGCVKCHRIGEQGGRIGPDLTGVGRRFSRIHLVESILEPSRAVAPAYRNTAIRLKDGQIVTGVKVLESDAAITLGDAQGQVRTVLKSQIDEQRALELSLMPEGLEKALTDREFVDLIAFLADQR
jgi:putative membrane-bound dehydrogenase-like protein